MLGSTRTSMGRALPSSCLYRRIAVLLQGEGLLAAKLPAAVVAGEIPTGLTLSAQVQGVTDRMGRDQMASRQAASSAALPLLEAEQHCSRAGRTGCRVSPQPGA